MAQCAHLLDPLYQLMKKDLLSSKVIGTDDTSVKVLDRKLSFARIGRIWPYVGDAHHPVIVYDYTPTRSRAGPAKFLEGYQGYLQADAYSVYDAFFKPQRGMTEVGCWMHARRYLFKALESDESRMGPGLHLIARLYAVEERAKALSLSAEAEVGIAPASVGAADREAPPVSAEVAARGSAEESVRRCRALCAESVGGANALSRRRRVGD